MSNIVQAVSAVLDAHGWQEATARPGRWQLPGTGWLVIVQWEWTSLYYLRAGAVELMQHWRTQDINAIGTRIAELTATAPRLDAAASEEGEQVL